MNTRLYSKLNTSEYYTVEDFWRIMPDVDTFETVRKRGNKGRKIPAVTYYNIPVAFDIETSSFYDDGEKVAIMYEWTCAIDGIVFVGRTWSEYHQLYNNIVQYFDLSDTRRLIIYVHNLAHEFQFLRHHHEWSKVFALKNRTPVYAITSDGVEYRCSYILSGYSLAVLGRNLLVYKVQKLVGDLDYSKIRHHKTPMSATELQYCINDVMVVSAYIQERIESDGDITKIPLTVTGYVRRHCRKKCLYVGKNVNWHYRNLMKRLTIEPNEYELLQRAFQGGFTHASYNYSRKIVDNVTSYDECSAYPAVMIAEGYPMSKGKLVKPSTRKDFERYLEKYCCLIEIELSGVISIRHSDHPISSSRCQNLIGAVIDNGRVVSADKLTTVITEVDYNIYRKFYDWDTMRIGRMYIYRRAYLPTEFVDCILSLYEDKTTLKDVAGSEAEYQHAKGMLNSAYGMCVMSPVRDAYDYDNDMSMWTVSKSNLAKSIDEYNTAKNRFLFYPWGVWVTAYARRNLFTAIYAIDRDYIYSDTDSVKFKNLRRCLPYFERYNKAITEKMRRACEYHSFDPQRTCPKTIKGKSKPLGVWENDGTYTQFKTLGAKRYMYTHDTAVAVKKSAKTWTFTRLTAKRESNIIRFANRGKLIIREHSITVAGANKSLTAQYLAQSYGKKALNHFDDGLTIPVDFSGRLIHTYIDDRREGVVCDYLGEPAEYRELSAVHLEASEYHLSLAAEYKDYLEGLQYVY